MGLIPVGPAILHFGDLSTWQEVGEIKHFKISKSEWGEIPAKDQIFLTALLRAIIFAN